MIKANKSLYLIYIIYLLSAVIAFWYWHVDEHYQIFEFASFKLGITPEENLAWEYHSMIRSAILPYLAYIISKLSLGIGINNPFIIEAFGRILTTCIFLSVLKRLVESLAQEFSIQEKDYSQCLVWSSLLWILPMVMVRMSSEAWGATLFWAGFLVLYKKQVDPKQLFWIGFLWGLAFYIRIHVSILIGVFLVYSWIRRELNLKNSTWIFIGFLASSLIEFLANLWLYGKWIWSPYLYFKANIIDHVAASFGVQPWYFYVTEIWKNLIFPIGIFVLFSIISFFRKYPRSIYTWMILLFIFLHSLISHKEYRFLFPIFPILGFCSYAGFYFIKRNSKLGNKIFRFVFIVNLLILPSIFFIQSFKPYNYLRLYPYTEKYDKIYSLKCDVYSLDCEGMFTHVKSYFWKHPSCKSIMVSGIEKLPNNAEIFVSFENLGSSIVLDNQDYEKVFETIPSSLKARIPNQLLNTIDQIYLYRRVRR